MAKRKKLTPAQEEAAAKKRSTRSKKAAKTRTDRYNERVTKAIWFRVEPMITTKNCHCSLQPGLSLPSLVSLGAGCTGPTFVCPVLDAYRRYLERPSEILEQYERTIS